MSEEQGAITAEKELAALRKELAETRLRLAETYKMASIGRLLAGITHEINAPVGSIRSNNEVISRSLEKIAGLLASGENGANASLDKVRQLLETCQTLNGVDRIACERISSVIRNLKTLARVEQSDLRRVKLHEIIDNALKLAYCDYQGRVTVETDFGELPEVECYAEKMGQVFLNILINAGQAIHGEGKVVIRTRHEDGQAHVSISDNGPGIDEKNMARLFTSGFTTKPIGVGTGLGLSICKGIVVKDHRGSIEAESRPGEGATFHIRIPIDQTEESAS